jgi:hypothetical protein
LFTFFWLAMIKATYFMLAAGFPALCIILRVEKASLSELLVF